MRREHRFPHLKPDVLVDEFLNIAPHSGVRGDDLPQVEFIEGGRLPCVVQAHDHDLVLLCREKHEPEP